MQELQNIARVYFIGIGGIGMSALARYYVSIGVDVAGYDKTETEITNALTALGIQITFEAALNEVPKSYLDNTSTLVVYTPAIPVEQEQLCYFQEEGFQVLKRSQVLGVITRDVFTLAVAGTHGKTTTSTILAHLLYESGIKVTAFLGGISENYNSNYLSSGNDVVVVEADEFDRSFLNLHPNISAITSMDADHLDIYGNADALVQSFEDFAALNRNQLLVTNGLSINGISVGLNDGSAYEARDISIANGSYFFNLKTPDGVIENIEATMPGHHNLKNAITAMAMALEYGVEVPKLIKALKSFKGIQRRFSYQIQTNDLVFIDDYAHHPTEINALHQAVREMHQGKKVLAVFQPHLFSRTKDFAEDFAKSLSQFDEIWLLDIYPARELPLEGVNSQWLLSMIENEHKRLVSKEQLVNEISAVDAKIIVTIGAGDIGAQVKKIKQELEGETV